MTLKRTRSMKPEPFGRMRFMHPVGATGASKCRLNSRVGLTEADLTDSAGLGVRYPASKFHADAAKYLHEAWLE